MASSTKPAPEILSLWKMTAEAIYAARMKAPHTTLTGVTDADFNEVAFYLGRRRPDIAKIAPAQCYEPDDTTAAPAAIWPVAGDLPENEG